ncbi:DNA polymerase I [Borreliella burgdorferi]|uniref:DNA polymerase I n=3 Tax=Borreliella burgdorferi TaxID=139 RepID=DPO1_BORBU|nr:DNA polymerase I [Borreliella burgdorferi]O51498.1 RecName: Full=DNA polymerase I; Short=POL I [Borreliella burgdorferi B31]AGS66549.1 DNA polymerase I [Borreliella burgdorferi CA382]AAC66909.1 DNA polymerase I superfamily [Borreliella burgdorferi B31]MCD2378732.1 DNA polymerase I [Borreliella burgdorferi]MCD2402631.1 DNA polymerase I [Borreliella burgdorferi]MCD2409567.1 DNA polymerase I [Borreliella burgdorferi]
MKELYLIDALNIIFRNYHVMKNYPLLNTQGENVNAFIGFFKTLFFIIKEKNPEHLIITFDSEVPTFRKQKYPSYKATRDLPPDDLIPQIGWIKEGLLKAKIPIFEMEGYEADDLLASFAKKAAKNNYLTYIISPDKDLLQTMSEYVKILKIENNSFIEMDNEYVTKKFGVNSFQIKDYLAIVGDRSDNIPGIKGIGAKGAANLLREFKTLDGIYSNLEIINKKHRELLIKEKENAFLSYELVSLEENLKIPEIENFALKNFSEEIISLFEKHSAIALIKTYKKDILKQEKENADQKSLFKQEPTTNSLDDINTIDTENVKYRSITTKIELDDLIESLKKAKYISIDTETSSLDTYTAKLIGISISFKEFEGYYIPIEAKGKIYIEKNYIIQKFNNLFESNPKIIGQNYKFDYKILKNNGFNPIPPYFDTMIAAYLIDTNSKVSLDFLAEKYLMHKNIKYEDVIQKNDNFANISLEMATSYSSEDADITFRLFNIFTKKLKEDKLDKLMHEIEMPFNKVIIEMEENGIYLDKEYLKEYGKELGKELEAIENEIIKSIGIDFNLNSPKQMHEILFEKLNLKLPEKMKKDSTDIKVLESLREQHESIENLIKYRQIAKLKSTYTDNLIELINYKTNRLHTSFIQTKTATGRITSINPNLQNIPIKDEKGRKIRKAFKPENGNIFISADYSQIELAILAHLSQDEVLIKAFENNKDIHTETASKLFKIEEKEITPNLRRIAKSINFGIIYRMSDFRLAKELGITKEEAKGFINSYFDSYPKIKEFIINQINFVRNAGYSETILKRRRYIKEINSNNYLERSAAERIAINSIIQGSAADIMKIAMVKVFNEFKSKKMESKILLQVHDEMLIESPIEEENEVKKILKIMMETAYTLNLPLRANIETGKSWGEIH